LIADWREVLPASSVCLVVPIVPPSQAGGLHAREQEREAARLLEQEIQEGSTQASAPEVGP
jgi:hypothetical protein